MGEVYYQCISGKIYFLLGREYKCYENNKIWKDAANGVILVEVRLMKHLRNSY